MMLFDPTVNEVEHTRLGLEYVNLDIAAFALKLEIVRYVAGIVVPANV